MEVHASQLTSLVARGDRQSAASLLVHCYAPVVFALFRAMVRDTQIAEDLSQDAFARAFSALAEFRAETPPRTWLLALARNRGLEHLGLKRAPWDREPEADDAAPDEAPPIDLLARREDAERAMDALGETERALVVLHFGHGLGYAELAESFGLAQGAVRMRVSRALARMRGVLREVDDDLAVTGRFRIRESTDELAVTGRYPIRRAVSSELDESEAPASPVGLSEDLDERAISSVYEDSEAVRTPPTFESLRDQVPPRLRSRLETLATSL
jgi:RNA polymerase sigma-70 factor (ECF subfamily)